MREGCFLCVCVLFSGICCVAGKNPHPLPSGTFARAILLSGVDSPTLSATTRPVLLRILGSGVLPHQVRLDLKGCHVLASASGDLSCERVYIKLEKMICASPSKHVWSQRVEGYVVGEDGKIGMRGVVVDKAGPFLRSALWGGFLVMLNHLVEKVPSLPLRFRERVPGLSTLSIPASLEKILQVLLQRVQELQPVLQVSAGRVVDLVFCQESHETEKRQTKGEKRS